MEKLTNCRKRMWVYFTDSVEVRKDNLHMKASTFLLNCTTNTFKKHKHKNKRSHQSVSSKSIHYRKIRKYTFTYIVHLILWATGYKLWATWNSSFHYIRFYFLGTRWILQIRPNETGMCLLLSFLLQLSSSVSCCCCARAYGCSPHCHDMPAKC